jgi:hypothetical protein
MADQSNYTTEEHTIMITWLHEKVNIGKTIHIHRKDFQQSHSSQNDHFKMRKEFIFKG